MLWSRVHVKCLETMFCCWPAREQKRPLTKIEKVKLSDGERRKTIQLTQRWSAVMLTDSGEEGLTYPLRGRERGQFIEWGEEVPSYSIREVNSIQTHHLNNNRSISCLCAGSLLMNGITLTPATLTLMWWRIISH